MTVAIFRSGPANITYGGVDIGQTKGDVVFKYTPEWRLFQPDQSTGPQGAFIVNEAVELTVPLIPRKDALNLIQANIIQITDYNLSNFDYFLQQKVVKVKEIADTVYNSQRLAVYNLTFKDSTENHIKINC